ncbi:MAG: LPS export ABC transporter permease LptG [Alphaproteobacteria bacterium]|nr:LPS export ABC transporter permease LptG [Alphaproteobacteria bacterium]
MKLSTTLFAYLGRQYLFWLIGVFVVFMAIALLFDVVEMLRRTSGKEGVTLGLVLQLSLLKLPFLAQVTFPIMILFAAMLTFWRLARANEAVVARAAGISAWQFIFPAFLITAILGILQVVVISPFSAAMLNRYQQLEAEHVKHRKSRISVSQNGLWLRQKDGDGHAVIHALRVSPNDLMLHDVIIFRFGKDNRFLSRIDAKKVQLRKDLWFVPSGWQSDPKPQTVAVSNLRIPTDLTKNNILESFAPPETMSFWHLPDFIETIEAAGFPGHRHRLHFQALIASPILLSSMILIAASFTLRINRRTGTTAAVLGGLMCSFALYFLTDIVHALGLSASIPILLAAWTPAGISMLVGLAMLFHLEDG